MTRLARASAGLALLGGVFVVAAPVQAASKTYHVDCTGGRDGNDGRGAANAVKTLTKAGQLPLQPGDKLMLRRGCTWSGGQRLDVAWNGTAAAPITIGTYGTGPRPVIKDGKNQGIKVTGSHIVIKRVHVTFSVGQTTTVNGCAQPVGDYYGVNFTGGARHVTLQDSLITNANAGVHLAANSSNITVLRNKLHGNNVMNVFGGNPNRDLGAWGVLVGSDDNEIAYNEFKNNKAVCANSAGTMHSNSVEIFTGKRNYIHHNKSFGDRVFSELGGSANEKAADNVFEFNLHSSGMADARFITSRGGDSGWGPVYRTTVEHNTVRLTGPGSVAVSCGEGCGKDILTLRGNILSATDKSLFADRAPTEADNLFWNPDGQTRIQYNGLNKYYRSGTDVLNGSKVADPAFSNVNNGNYRPRKWSKAVNHVDSSSPSANVDLGYRQGIVGSKRDAGAYEMG